MENPLVDDYLEARLARDKAQARFAEVEERLIKQMEADQRKSFHWNRAGQQRTLTYVGGHTTQIDEIGLRKAMGARNFDRYTHKVLDRRAMERAMDTGEVDSVTVSRFVTLKPKKPYLKYSEKEESE